MFQIEDSVLAEEFANESAWVIDRHDLACRDGKTTGEFFI